MAGIYIHIPFCKQACNYCNFHFSTSLNQKEAFLLTLLKEIELTLVIEKNIETIYFGGGTPSLLSIDDLTQLLAAIKKKFFVVDDAEITLEANPDDITLNKLTEWKKIGINRFSIGIQSFDEEELKWMNRAHNATEALECIDKVLAAGFNNFSVDIIYGSPLQSNETLLKNLKTITEKRIPHISCYALTVEPKTALQLQIEKGSKQTINLEKQAEQNLIVIQKLIDEGYEHYEISNFSLPNMHSKHNRNYWKGVAYYGFGPSAHSFDGIKTRQWNIANNALYISSIHNNKIPFEVETLTDTEQLNEFMMISLRTSKGIDLKIAEDKFGINSASLIKKQFDKVLTIYGNDKLIFKDNTIFLTNEGKLFADGIASDMFLD